MELSALKGVVGDKSPLHSKPPVRGLGRSMSEIAFHEKAGWSQVDFAVSSLDKVFSPAESPLSPCFHPHS
jgi:hypothetical protein